MTTTKTEIKGAATETKRKEPKQEDLLTAYEIHTLTQMIYGGIASAHPWATPTPPQGNYQYPSAWMPSMHAGVSPGWPVPPHWLSR